MTALIKATDQAAMQTVRPISGQSGRTQPAVAPADGALAILRDQIAALAGELEERDAMLRRLKAEVESARREGEAAGRLAGAKQAEVQSKQSLDRLDYGIRAAVDCFAKDLSSLDRLAAVLAREGLAKILGDQAHYSDLVRSIVRRQVDSIEAGALIRVEVSQRDFPDETALVEFSAADGRPALEVTTSNDLAPGDCRIKLRLGTIEVGVGQQWGALSAFLAEIASPEAIT